MTKYVQIRFDISPKQKKSVAGAINSGSSVQLKLTNKQLHGESATALVTPTQGKRIIKAKNLGKGVVITLSKKQLEKMKTGGFLPLILGALVSSLAPVLFSRLFPGKSQDGEGIVLPGGRGMAKRKKVIDEEYQEGEGVEPGMIVPYNGESTSLNIAGYTSKNAGQGQQSAQGIRLPGRGSGIVLPGKTMARSGSKTAKQYVSAKSGAGMTKKKKPQRAMGYVAPGSEKYQMLE